MPRAIFHCHSTYSDGELTLAELRELFVAEGLDFACMTDHAEFFDDESLRAYRDECDALSDERFRFVAGLEYECERRMHVLGYGVTTLAATTDPQAVIRHIEAAGGVSVIAHRSEEHTSELQSRQYLVCRLLLEKKNKKKKRKDL